MSAWDDMRQNLLRLGSSLEAAEQFIAEKKTEVNGIQRAIIVATLNDAADRLVSYCPDHGTQATCFMTCQCLAAEELRDMAKQIGGAA